MSEEKVIFEEAATSATKEIREVRATVFIEKEEDL